MDEKVLRPFLKLDYWSLIEAAYLLCNRKPRNESAFVAQDRDSGGPVALRYRILKDATFDGRLECIKVGAAYMRRRVRLHDVAVFAVAAGWADIPMPISRLAGMEPVPARQAKVPRWTLLPRPNAMPGYRAALYEYLATKKHVPNRPTASDVVDEWNRKPVFPVTSVDDGIVLYENAKGVVVKVSDTREKTLDAIRNAINRLTKDLSEKRTQTGR